MINANQSENLPIVFLRGLIREQRHWGGFTEYVQRCFPERECIFLDIPGNGGHYQQRSPTSIKAMAIALSAQLADSVEHQQRIDIVSLSLGAMVALAWAELAPKKINHVVMMNASLKNYSPFYQRLKLTSIYFLLSNIWRSAEHKEQAILKLTSNCEQQLSAGEFKLFKQSTLQHWLVIANSQPISVTNTFRQLLAAARFSITTKPPVPISLLAAKYDRLVDYRCSQAIADAWHVPLYTHNWAGHDIVLDDRQWVCQQLQHILCKQ